jgi:hypothetical protein
MDTPFRKNGAYPSGKFESRSTPRASGAYTPIIAGSFTPVTDWRHNADPALEPMRRSSGGANTPIPEWLHNAGQ